MKLRNLLTGLLLALLLLLLTGAVVLGVARLLAALGDAPAARALDYIALAIGILLAVDLVSVVLLVGFLLLAGMEKSESEEEEV